MAEVQQALVIGDSQAQGAGAVLESLLVTKGYKVERHGFAGYQTYKIRNEAKKLAGKDFDLVCVFSGSNDSPGDHSSALELVNIWPKAQVWWFAPPPATYILDLPLAQKVFGSHITSPEHWAQTGFAASREKIAKEFRETLKPAGSRVRYLDIRSQFPNGYPAQPDGLHITKTTAQDALPGLIEVAVAPPKKAAPWGIVGLAAAIGAGAWLWHQSGPKRNPELTPKQKRNLVWGVTAAVGALWLLWPKKSYASGGPMSDFTEESELLKVINPAYLKFSASSAKKWPHARWGGVPTDVARKNVALIDKMMKDEGYPLAARAAAVVNAYYESGFNHLAVGDNGASIGLFQLNKWGGGIGMTPEQRAIPETNIMRMLDSIGGRPVPKKPDGIALKFKKLVDSGETSVSKLAGAFCRYFERPADTEGATANRSNAAKKMFKALA